MRHVFLLVLCCSQMAQARVHVTREFKHVVIGLGPGDILMGDWDRSTIADNGDPGSETWVDWRRGYFATSSLSQPELGRLIFTEMGRLIHRWPKTNPVESDQVEAIHEAQARGVVYIAATARLPVHILEQATELQMRELGLTSNGPRGEIQLSGGAKYKDGILYTTPFFSKGKLIAELFGIWKWRPRQARFWDDKHHNARSVSEELTRLGLDVRSYHYTRGLENLQPYRGCEVF